MTAFKIPEEEIVKAFKYADEAFTDLKPKMTLEEAKELMARDKTGGLLPAPAVQMSRSWRAIERVLGPGKSLLTELASAFPALAKLIERRAKIPGLAGKPSAHRLKRGRDELDAVIKEFEKVRVEIEKWIDEVATPLRLYYRPWGGEKVRQDPVRSFKNALAEFAEDLRLRRAALAALGKKIVAMSERAKRRALVITAFVNKRGGLELGVGHTFKSLSRFGDVGELGERLLQKLLATEKKGWPKLFRKLLSIVGEDSLLFVRAVAIMAHIKLNNPAKWKLFRKAAKNGEWQSVQGDLNQLRGLFPEAATDALGHREALGNKKASEILADLPPEVAKDVGKMAVEHVKGPFWIIQPNGTKVEFSDGASLLLDEVGETGSLLLLAETTTRLRYKKFKQIFARPTSALKGSIVHYVDKAGKLRSVRLKPLPGGHTPVYVFTTLGGLTPEEEKELAKVTEFMMQSEREVYMSELPVTRADNEVFVEQVFRVCVKLLDVLKPLP